MKTLDRSRDFGTVHPPYEGAHFEQDGYHFDAQGKIVEALLTTEQKDALAKKVVAKPPKPQGAEGNSQPNAPSGQQKQAAGDKGKGDDDALNIEEWLRDEQSANFLDVRKAIKARFSVWITDKPGAVAFLVNEQKLLGADEIDPELRKFLPQSAAA